MHLKSYRKTSRLCFTSLELCQPYLSVGSGKSDDFHKRASAFVHCFDQDFLVFLRAACAQAE